jgi:hypothetical protein
MIKFNHFVSMVHRRFAGTGCFVGLFVLCIPISVSATDLYGLVIGIDDYQTFSTLDGAINDSNDIADALNKVGAKQVILLQDKKADRDNIFRKWKSLTSQAKKDDVLVFAYAGHGSQEKEHVSNSESFGLDENFILANFANRGQMSYQRIVDDEIDALFRETPDLKILFIADSCHSGTMTRAFSAPKKFKKRSIPTLNIENDALTELYGAKNRGNESVVSASSAKKGESINDRGAASNVFGIGAVPDDQEVVEITDPDTKKSRAALSIAFAKVLRFDAANKEREISKERLQLLITENVRMLTDGQQTPQFSGGSVNFSIPINSKLSSSSEGDRKPSVNAELATATSSKQPADFTVFVTNVPATVTEDQWRSILGQAKVTTNNQTASAIWNIGEEKIYSQLGDVVYDGRQPKIQETRAFSRAKSPASTPSGSVEIAYATKVFDKLIAVERIKKRSEVVSPTIVLKPNNRLHRAGESVILETSNQKYPYLTLFNMASDGTINNLYPLQDGEINDPLEVALNKPYPLPLNVELPYGGDHFVVIFSEKPLNGLHKELQKMNGGQNANQIEATLDRHLQGIKHQIGIHGVFTGA